MTFGQRGALPGQPTANLSHRPPRPVPKRPPQSISAVWIVGLATLLVVAAFVLVGLKIAAVSRIQEHLTTQPALQDAQVDLESVAPNVVVQTYEITGRDAGSIRASLNAAGPVDSHEHRSFDANTRWFIDWNWQGDGRGGCDLANATVTFHATVLLPELTGIETLSPDLAHRWRSYLAALKTHEAGHVRYAYEHVGDVRSALASSTCGGANAAAQAAVAVIAQHDVAYDLATHDGATQGAVFP
jgi:predicted secreted Zn-dependent protease